MAPTPFRLSKSRYLAGLQCHRQLWWKVHDPAAAELKPGASLQAIFDMGTRVGERARQEFPGATLIDFDYKRIDDAVAATKEALDRGASAILEASFLEDGVFVAVDALSKEGGAWVVTEVKATAGVKSPHIADAAVQAHVVDRAGLRVGRVELMHLNNKHRHPDEGPLFIRANITDAVAELRMAIPAQTEAQQRMLGGPLPDIEPGEHCRTPRLCPFLDRCHAPAPDHPIDDLNRISETKLVALHDEGIETVDQIPSDFPLSALQKRHRAAVLRDEMIVEPGLQSALAAYRYPIAMLDFETINPALPVWNGCSPFGKVPVQFSVHTLDEHGEVSHRAVLADGEDDPRPGVAEALVGALAGAGTVLVWNAGFEKECLGILAASSPEHASTLLEARNKVEDLLPVVRNHVYHPDFRGSFSIKVVARALLPEMAYDDLEVADGQVASFYLETLLCRPDQLSAEERGVLREQLAAYCAHDTAVMIELFHFLQEAAALG